MWKLECTRYPSEPKPTKNEAARRRFLYAKIRTRAFLQRVKKKREREVVAKVESLAGRKPVRNQVSRHRRDFVFKHIPFLRWGKKHHRSSDFTRKPRAESGGAGAEGCSRVRTQLETRRITRVAAGNSIRGVSAKSVVLLVCYFSDPRSSSFARNFETAQNSQPPAHGTIDPTRAQFGRAR